MISRFLHNTWIKLQSDEIKSIKHYRYILLELYHVCNEWKISNDLLKATKEQISYISRKKYKKSSDTFESFLDTIILSSLDYELEDRGRIYLLKNSRGYAINYKNNGKAIAYFNCKDKKRIKNELIEKMARLFVFEDNIFKGDFTIIEIFKIYSLNYSL